MADLAWAQGMGGGAGGPSPIVNLLPIALMFVILYFLMIRPQQKRLKEHQAMIAAIRRGDTIVTSGGIIGKVAKVEDQELQVEIAEGVKIKILRSTVSEVRGKGEGAASSAKAKDKDKDKEKDKAASE